MPPNKEITCAGCEEFRPLLYRYRGWKDVFDVRMEQQAKATRSITHDDAVLFLKFVKHWPTNIHMVSAHINSMFKTQEDVHAMHGITLSFITLGLKTTGLFLLRQAQRALDTSSRHSSTGSTSESLPDASNSEPGSNTVSPLPEESVNTLKTKLPLEVVDLTSTSPDNDVILVNDGDSSIDQPNSSSQGANDTVIIPNEPSTSTEDNKEYDEDPGLHNWSAKELDELCCNFHRIFAPHFPLYLAAKNFMRPEERARSEQMQMIPLFMETFFFWYNRGGLDQMTMYFQNATVENADLAEALMLSSMSFHVRHFVLYEGLFNAIGTFRAHVMNYLLRLPIEEFRKSACKNIADMMWTFRREQAWPHVLDTEGLNLAYKFFSCSSHLTLRLVGLTEISQYISTFHEYMQELEPRVAMQVGAHMARWILEKRIVEEIFGQNAHVELISRSFHVINFLSNHQALSAEHVDCIWNAAQMNYISRHVMEMLPNIIKNMEPSRLIQLYRKLGEMDTSQHSEQSILVISLTIRTIWIYAINQKSPANVAPSSPPKRPSFSFQPSLVQKVLKRQLAGAGSPSEESASSCTGSEDESGSEDYESDDQEGSSGLSKIPGIATLVPSRTVVPPNVKLDPKLLQLRLANLQGPSLVIGRRNSVTIAHDLSSEEGSSEDEEDCEDEEEDDGVEEAVRSVQSPRSSRMLRSQLMKSSSSERSKRSPCPSRDSISLQPRKRPALDQHTSNVMERLLSATPIARSRLPPPKGQTEGSNALNSLHLLAGMPMGGGRPQQISPLEVDTSGEIDDDLMTQASDGADAEVNSSTSDMSEKMQDIDLDLSETQPEEEAMVMEEDDDMDISSSDPNNSTISEDAFRIKANLQAQAHKIRQVQLFEALAKNRTIEYKIDDVTKPGMTLLWDLLQENDPGSVSPVVLLAAERELVGLIITSQNVRIIARFFDSCHENVKQHRAVCVSLRLLSKLIPAGQFNQKLEKVQQVVAHFFADLALFADNPPREEMRKTTEIRVRLNFLQLVFSSQLTDKKFRLRVEDVEVLWRCFVEKLQGLDEICGWLQIQLNCTDSHALNAQTIYHLFKEHLGKLKPASMTITAFKLYLSCMQSLTGLDMTEGIKVPVPNVPVIRAECADIAWLCAMFGGDEVSEQAIKHLNNYYCVQCIKSQKEEKGTVLVNYKEQEFIKRNMEYISKAMPNLSGGTLEPFKTVTRCFFLMRRHIESYRQKYGFHLRLWQLTGSGVLSHQPLGFSPVMHIRGYCYFHVTFSLGDERTVERTISMIPTNTFGELRAELIHELWKACVDKSKAEPKDPREALEQLYNFIDSRGGPMYVTHRNTEYGQDSDEMSLHELQLRQAECHILVTFGSSRKPKISVKVPSLPPSRETIPMIIAASCQNFEILLELQRLQDSIGTLDVEAETLRKGVSRHLWDFMTNIPTSEVVMDRLRLRPPMDHPTKEQWKQLLPADNPHRLLYALQALDNLSLYPTLHGSNLTDKEVCTNWAEQIIAKGGFERLYELILTPSLQEATGTNDGLEHQRECLCMIMKVIYTLSVDSRRPTKVEEDSGGSSSESSGEEVMVDGEGNKESPEGRKRKSRTKSDEKGGVKKGRPEGLPIIRPITLRFKQSVLQILDTTDVLTALMKFQYNSVIPLPQTDQKPSRHHRHIRQQVVKLAFEFLINWASWNSLVIPALSKHEFLTEWIRRLALESVDSHVTLETCVFIERMCRMEPDYELSCSLLIPLVALMPMAEGFKCLRQSGRDDKIPVKPSSRHFYESVSKLLEIIPTAVVVDKVDLDSLCAQIAVSLENRPIYEPRSGCLEDDGLIGLLRVATLVLSHNPEFKFKSSGQKLLLTVHSLLYDLPTLKNRDLPKCKSQASRMAGYTCLIEITKHAPDNFISLGRLLLKDELERYCQLWDYWPRDDTRADCGYVGINNLGATCYMATTMQHLYMIPEVRKTVLEALPINEKNASANALHEMQRMFAFLLDSERKAYSPDPFCRVYEMNNQPLNPTEQKDMMEYFSDLVTKMEDMSPSMKEMVHRLFTGTNCNTVVSLDCGHVSQTTEDFTTVRCQVNNMRNLYESLNDVCVKDVLEGNNMYKCGQCNREVRAEKRACFRSLPEILVLNTLRYTFNMVTMQREKVNTHFFFPLKLDMSSYMEENIYRKEGAGPVNTDQYNYELIGVTVHTGTADGGHYYSFIRDLESGEDDRWCLFNDAEVRQFDTDQLGDECFGGEQHKQFEHPSDRFLDFGLEKTNSAYMVFYQRSEKVREQLTTGKIQPNIPKNLQKWVFDDTVTFIHDTNIFDRQYFEFIYKLCANIPSSFPAKDQPDAMNLAGQLGISFMWQTLVHARDRILTNNFFDLIGKICSQPQSTVVEWFFHHMVDDNRWLNSILVACPVGQIRFSFQRFVAIFFQRLRPQHQMLEFYTHDMTGYSLLHLIGRFCRQCLALLNDNEIRAHWRSCSDLFIVLFEFAKIGVTEAWFLLVNGLFTACYQFYMNVRRLKDVASPVMGPFNLTANILEIVMLGAEEADSSDRFSPDLDKDKPNALSHMVRLLKLCIEHFQFNVFNCKQLHLKNEHASPVTPDPQVLAANHGDIEQFVGAVSDTEQLDFICALIRDGVESFQTPRLAAMLYFDKPEKARLAVHYIIQKIIDLSLGTQDVTVSKKERDKDLQVRQYLHALAEIIKYGIACATNLSTNVTPVPEFMPEMPRYATYLLERMDNLIMACPITAFQWLSDHAAKVEELKLWCFDHMDWILEQYGVSVGKPPSAQREDLQIEVSRLIVSLSSETKLKELFCPYPQGIIFSAVKEKYPTVVTARDKFSWPLSDEQHQWICSLINKVLSFFDNLCVQYPTILNAEVSTESYQWILFAIQFLLIDDREKAQVVFGSESKTQHYITLRKLLLSQMSPSARHGCNRQALLQLLTAVCHNNNTNKDDYRSRVIQDKELLDCLLSDVELRTNEEPVILEREGRTTGALLALIEQLCLNNDDFLTVMAKDSRLLAKLRKGMHLKLYEMCKRPMVALLTILIKNTEAAVGETFRKQMLDVIISVKAQWPASMIITNQLARRIVDGAPEEFQMYAIENKMMNMLTENFRTNYTAVNKSLTFMYDEATWSLTMLRRLKALATAKAESSGPIMEALQDWTVMARQMGREMQMDIVAIVNGSGPVELNQRNVIAPRTRR